MLDLTDKLAKLRAELDATLVELLPTACIRCRRADCLMATLNDDDFDTDEDGRVIWCAKPDYASLGHPSRCEECAICTARDACIENMPRWQAIAIQRSKELRAAIAVVEAWPVQERGVSRYANNAKRATLLAAFAATLER